MADYTVYNPPLDDTDYPAKFDAFFPLLSTDMTTVQGVAAANAAYIADIGTTGFSLNDGVALTLGTGNDTTILHTGTNTDINHVGTGDLRLINTSNIIAVGDTYVNLLDNIALNFGNTQNATIRYDLTNTELDITSTNIHLTGIATITGAALITGTTVANGTVSVNGNIELRNNDHLYLGDTGKIDIYTSGSASYFSAGVGGLIIANTITSALITIRTDNSSGTSRDGIIIGGATPNVRLNYQGATKLSTSASGITVTGGVTTDSIYRATGVLTITSPGGVSIDGTLNGTAIGRGCLVNGGAINVLNNVWTPLHWISENYDTDDIHSNTVNPARLTVPTGVTKIKLTAQLVWNGGTASGVVRAAMSKNDDVTTPTGTYGLGAAEEEAISGHMVQNFSSSIIEVVAGDYFSIAVYQNSGTNRSVLNFDSTIAYGSFSMEIIK